MSSQNLTVGEIKDYKEDTFLTNSETKASLKHQHICRQIPTFKFASGTYKIRIYNIS
jgi:hypothetical protein